VSAVSRERYSYQITPIGDQSISIEFGAVIDVEINRLVCALARRIESAALAGVVDVLPSFSAVGVHYLAAEVPTGPGERVHAAITRRLRGLVEALESESQAATRTVEIPVCYGGEHGPDLEEAAQACSLSAQRLVDLHTRAPLRVFMIGFTPGHPYIGLLDEQLDLPRRASPRTVVPAGSVAIANRQSVIYPLATPGGWHLIGRTPLRLFDAQREQPCLLQPGDEIRFRAVSGAEFDAWPQAAVRIEEGAS